MLWLAAPMVVLAVMAVGVTLLFAARNHEQSAYWQAERLRRLAEIAETLEKTVDSLSPILAGAEAAVALEESCKKGLTEKDGSRFCGLELYKRQAAAFQFSLIKKSGMGMSGRCYGKKPRPVFVRHKTGPQIRLRSCSDDNERSGEVVEVSFRIRNLLEAANAEAFPHLVLLGADKKTLLSFGALPGQPHDFTWLLDSKGRSANEGNEASAGLWLASGGARPVDAPPEKAPAVQPFRIGERSYLAFVQPIFPLPGAQRPVAGDSLQLENGYLVGIMEEQAFEDLFHPPLIAGTLGVLLFVIGFLAWPHAKLHLAGPAERLHKFDVVALVLSTLMGAGLVTIIFVAVASYLLVESMLDEQLEMVAAEIEESLQKDIRTTVQSLAELARDYPSEGTEWRFDIPGSVKGKCANELRSFSLNHWRSGRFPDLEEVSFLDKDGCVARSYTNRGQPSVYSPEGFADRAYFTGLEPQKSFYETVFRLERIDDRRVYIDRIWSRVSNRKLAAISIFLPDGADGDKGVQVAAAFGPLKSVFHPVLPATFGFAIVDDRDGRTLFHSDDRRALVERPLLEIEPVPDLRSAQQNSAHRLVHGRYRGRPHRLYFRPLEGMPWTLVAYRDRSVADILFFQSVSIASILLIFFLTILAITATIIVRLSGRGDWTWLWPDPSAAASAANERKVHKRLLLPLGVLTMLTFGLVVYALPWFRLLAVFAAPLLALLLMRRHLVSPRAISEGWSRGLETAALSALALAALSIIYRVGSAVLGGKVSGPLFAFELATSILLAIILGSLWALLPRRKEKLERPINGLLFLLVVLGGMLPAAALISDARLAQLDGVFRLVEAAPVQQWQMREKEIRALAERFSGDKVTTVHYLRYPVAPWLTYPLDVGYYAINPMTGERLDVDDTVELREPAAYSDRKQQALRDGPARFLSLLLPAADDESARLRDIERTNRLLGVGPDEKKTIGPEYNLPPPAAISLPLLVAPFPPGGLDFIIGVLVAAVFIVLAAVFAFFLFWATAKAAKRLFALDTPFFENLPSSEKLEAKRSRGGANWAIVSVSPRRLEQYAESLAKRKDADRMKRIDLRRVGWQREFSLLGAGYDTAVIEGVLSILADKDARGALLTHLERLVFGERKKTVIVLSSIFWAPLLERPEDYPGLAEIPKNMAIEERMRWLSLFKTFLRKHLPQEPANGSREATEPQETKTSRSEDFINGIDMLIPPGDLQKSPWIRDFMYRTKMLFKRRHLGRSAREGEWTFDEALVFLERECRPWPELEPIKKQLRLELRARRKANCHLLSKDQIVDLVLERAEPFYRAVWKLCSKTERLVLFNLTQSPFINPGARTTIRRLTQRGLIERDPYFKIVNESFGRFAETADPPESQQAWRAEGGSIWRLLRAPLAVGLAALGIAVIVFGGPLLESTRAMAAALAAAGPALLTIRALTAGGGK